MPITFKQRFTDNLCRRNATAEELEIGLAYLRDVMCEINTTVPHMERKMAMRNHVVSSRLNTNELHAIARRALSKGWAEHGDSMHAICTRILRVLANQWKTDELEEDVYVWFEKNNISLPQSERSMRIKLQELQDDLALVDLDQDIDENVVEEKETISNENKLEETVDEESIRQEAIEFNNQLAELLQKVKKTS